MKKLGCVLLVDDDDITNSLNKYLFNKLNIADELMVARNGQMAIDVIQNRCNNNQKCPDLILLDINMPVMNGFEFLEAYQNSNLYDKSSVIVMMLTTSVNNKDIENAKHPYITDFLNKPLTQQMLNGIMEKYFKSE